MTIETVIAEGKTKQILQAPDSDIVRILQKPTVTKGDGDSKDIITDKDIHSNTTTVNVFRLLNAHNVPNHYIERVHARSFSAHHCDMIPIECVVRRIATGSYLKRNPDIKEGTFFEDAVSELFIKDDARHDPMIKWDAELQQWELYDAFSGKGLDDKIPVNVRGITIDYDFAAKMRQISIDVFEIIESEWAKQDITLVDFKIEFGIAKDGSLLVADVIDNDSWRIWPAGDIAQEKSKQVYRNLENATPKDLSQIGKNYEQVAIWTEGFDI